MDLLAVPQRAKVGESMVYHVYGDLVFLLNVFFDFILLYGVAAFTKCDCKLWRLAGAAAVGGAYGVGALLPQLTVFYHQVWVVLFPVLLLLLAFGMVEWARLGRMLVYYYLLAFAMNGVAAAGSSLFVRQGLGVDLFNLIFLPALLALILGRTTAAYLRRLMAKDNCYADGRVAWKDKRADLKIFLDTGNNLTDPVSGLPVMVAEYGAVAEVLPKELRDEYETYGADRPADKNMVEFFHLVGEKYADADWFGRISLLSFRSVGQKQGFLFGFRADYLQMKGQSAAVVLALYDGRLGGRRGFTAIASPWILENRQTVKSLRKRVM